MFAQESVMDFQKEKEAFESVFTEAKGWDLTFIMGCYQNIETLRAFAGWLAAKAQAVLEKDAIIQKLSDQLYAQEMKTSGARVLCETACELLDGYAHQDAMVILNDLEQAMKEPTND